MWASVTLRSHGRDGDDAWCSEPRQPSSPFVMHGQALARSGAPRPRRPWPHAGGPGVAFHLSAPGAGCAHPPWRRASLHAVASAWPLAWGGWRRALEGAELASRTDVDQDVKKLSGRFLEFVHRATGLPMIVCDETGTIVHSVVRQRIGSKHAFAERIMKGEADEL